MEQLEERHLLAVLLNADFTDDNGFGDPQGFTSSGPADEWHLSTGRGNEPGHSPDTSFYFGGGEGPFGGGTYGVNADGTLTSPVVDLTNVDVASLSFNYLIEVEDDFDFATVSVLQGGTSTTIATSGTELPTVTADWRNATFDLTAFVGGPVQLQFRLTSDPVVVGEGWYIDDVLVETPVEPPDEVFTFSDENGDPDAQGFDSFGPLNQWHLSVGRANDAGHSFDDSFYFGSGETSIGGGSYFSNADGTLLSPSFDLTDATGATLFFNHFLQVEDGFDFARVSVIDSSGTTQIAQSGQNLSVETSGFEQVTLDLTPFIGESIQIAFRLTSDDIINFEGWYVDDIGVSIETAPEPETEVTDRWENQGPIGANHRFLQNIVGGNSIGGATHTVVAHPTDPNVLYIGAVNGGVWKTTNAQDAVPVWVPQTDDQMSQSISALAFDPSDSTNQTLVATTAGYSSFGGVSGQRGLLYRTTDGGDTWTAPGSNGILFENISGVAARGDTIVVSSRGGGGGIFRSTDGGANFSAINSADFTDNDNFSDLVEDPTNPNRLYAANTGEAGLGGPGGIYRSDDFGASWIKVTGAGIDAEMNDLLVASNNIEMAVSPQTGRLYVAILLSSQPEAVYHTNGAGTASPTWTRMDIPVLPQGDGIAIIGASNSAPIVITSPNHGLTNPTRGVNFVVIGGVTGNTAANGFHRINVLDANRFELTNTTGNGNYTGGGTWTKVAGPSPTPKNEPEGGAQGRTHFSIVADPTNEDIVYIGGDRQDSPNRINASNISGSIFRGDASIPRNPNVVPSPQWDHLTNDIVDFDPQGGTPSNSAPHADSREMVFDANGNLIEVDDGGVYKRTSPRDNTGDWHSLVGNLSATEIHDIAYDTNSNTLIAGLQDNGTLFQPAAGATFWDIYTGGDGGDVVVDPVTLAGSNQSIRYTSFQNLGAFRRSIWDASGNLVSESFPALTVVSGAPFDPAFSTPVELNQANPNRLLFGMDNGIYESLDQGETLTQVSSTISPTRSTGGNAIAYGGSTDENIAYVGDFSGNVHVRTAAGGAFVLTDPDPVSTATIRDVVLNPNVPNVAFAIDFNSVFLTDDSGVSWFDVTGDLAAIGASGFRSLEFVPDPGTNNVDTVVLGTETGIYTLRSDVGAPPAWELLGSDLPNVVVFDLDYDETDDVLVAGTMGRGAWLLDNVTQEIFQNQITMDISLDTGGALIISDSLDLPNQLSITADAVNSEYVISGVGQTFTVNANVTGATGDGTDSVTVPFATVTGAFIGVAASGGDDTLTLDFSGGDFPQDVEFYGGPSGRGDTLNLIGDSLINRANFDLTASDVATIELDSNTIRSEAEAINSEMEVGVSSNIIPLTPSPDTVTVSPVGLEQERIQIGSSKIPNLSQRPPRGLFDILGAGNDFNLLGTFDLDVASMQLTGQEVISNGAGIYTRQVGTIEINAERNLNLDDNTDLRTEDGFILLRGNRTNTPANGDFNGIFLDHADISSVNGDIRLEGRGGDGGDFNRGIGLFDHSRIRSTGTGANAGTITLEGTGGLSNQGARGIQIGNSGIEIETVDGNITLQGTGGAGASGGHDGIIFFDGTVSSTGAGQITLEGTGGAGGDGNIGIRMNNAGSTVTSAQANIRIAGTGGAGGNFNFGILVASEASVRSTGTGANAAAITLTGTGGSGNQSHRGIQLSGTTPRVTSIDGNITLDGTGGSGTGFNQGIIFFSGEVNSTGRGNVEVRGSGTSSNGVGVFMQGGSVIESTGSGHVDILARSAQSIDFFVGTSGGTARLGASAGTGNLTLTADTLDFNNASSVQGAGHLLIQPFDPATTVGIAGAAGTHNLSTTELSRLADGFSSITLGNRAAGTGRADIAAFTFSDPVTIVGGSVDLSGTVTGSDVEIIARTGEINDAPTNLTDIDATTVRLTGNVAPGESPGLLGINGNLIFSDNDVVTIEIAGTNQVDFDQIIVEGSVLFENNVTLVTQLLGNFSPSIGQQFLIVGANSITGEFAGLPEGAIIPSFLGSALGARITYQGGAGTDVVLTVVDPVPPPTVESIVVNDGGDSRSQVTQVVVTFDSEVSAPASAFQIRQRGSGTILDTLNANSIVNAAGRTVTTLSFGAGGNVVIDRVNGLHSLERGNYELTIDASQIQVVGGGPAMAADVTFGDQEADNFFRFYGDTDGDRDVDGTDYGRFGLSFLKSLGDPAYNEQLDSEGDNDVDGVDYGRFGLNFLSSLGF